MVFGFLCILKPFHWYLQLAVVERVMPAVVVVPVKVKLNFTLEQATKAPAGEQMCNSTLLSTSVLDGSGWSTPHPGHFTPEKDRVPIV